MPINENTTIQSVIEIIHKIQQSDLTKSEKSAKYNELYHQAITFKNRPDLHEAVVLELEKIFKPLRLASLTEDLRKPEYQNLSFDQKVAQWSGNLHQSMRWQGESGYDEYAIFSRAWYLAVKEGEPQFDKIMDRVFETKWKGYWSREEYEKRIAEG